MAEQAVTTASFEAADRHLRKAMPFEHLLFMSLGTIIGSGWLLASVRVAAVAGPGAIISWIVGGIFIMLVALTWAEISGMLPRSGAIVRYPQLTHGSLTGFLIGWAYWFPVTPAAEAVAVLTYLSGRFPNAGLTATSQGQTLLTWPRGILSGVGFMILFFALNYFGIRFLSEWNRWFVWWKIVVPVLTFVFLFFAFKGSNFHIYGGFVPKGPGAIFASLSTTGLIFAYLGFRQALEYGGEAKNPQRDVPLATIGGVLIAIVIYTLLQVAFLGAINWHAAGITAGNWTALTSSHWASSPLYSALSAASIGALGAFGTVLIIDAAVSPTGTAWIAMGTATRTFYGLSVNKYFPNIFQWMSRFGIPWVSLVGSFVIGLIFFIPIPSWSAMVSFITATTVITYLMGAIGLQTLRRYCPELPRPFRLPQPWLWAPLSFLAAAMLMYWAGFTTLANTFAAIFVGLPIYGAYFAWQKGWVHPVVGGVISIVFLLAWVWINHMGGWVLTTSATQLPHTWPFPIYDIAFSADVIFFCVALWLASSAEGRTHIQRAAWLIFLLLASFPLSYWGFLGPLAKPAINFPWDTLIEVGIGLIAYFCGSLSGFATEEIQAILESRGMKVGNEPMPLLPSIFGNGRRAGPAAGVPSAGR